MSDMVVGFAPIFLKKPFCSTEFREIKYTECDQRLSEEQRVFHLQHWNSGNQAFSLQVKDSSPGKISLIQLRKQKLAFLKANLQKNIFVGRIEPTQNMNLRFNTPPEPPKIVLFNC
jgi:hypothetical protein